MKKIFLLFLLSLPFFTNAQQTINYSISVNSVQRDFILYVPASYNANTSAPLVFSFHGLGGNAQVQMNDHDFRPVADTAGFIVAHPLGEPVVGPVRGWNFVNNSLPNDVLFTSEMIDTISASFNIDSNRIYACGMSHGGFFSVFLAGQLSQKIAAVASVAGTILNNVTDSLINPFRPVALLQIHGTNDNNVAYNGGQASKSVQYVLDLFIKHNNCDTIPSITPLPNTNPNDGSTVDRHVYANGNNGTTVEHLKVNGGGHTWPDENTNTQGVNRDVNGCVEIWKFFTRFDLNGSLVNTLNSRSINTSSKLVVYPNPAQDVLYWKSEQNVTEVRIFNNRGQLIGNRTVRSKQIDMSDLSEGLYLLQFYDGTEFLDQAKVMIQP